MQTLGGLGETEEVKGWKASHGRCWVGLLQTPSCHILKSLREEKVKPG